MMKLLLKGGKLFDSRKKILNPGDLLIENDSILDTGSDISAEAEEIDCTGKIVSPGFIDSHGHSDGIPLIDCDGGSKIHDGVTTEISGNCGASIFPDPETGKGSKRKCPFTGIEYEQEVSNLADYIELIEKQGMPINLAFLIGHSRIREIVLQREDRAADPEEVKQMCAILEENLDQGGIGLSLGFIYPPGCFARIEEIYPMAEIIKERDMIVSSHIRNEGHAVIDALKEFLSIGEKTGCKQQISHLKACWEKNWDKLEPALDLIRLKLKAGVDATADRYSYTASATGLDLLLPSSWYEGGNEKTLKRLKDPAARDGLLEHIYNTRGENVFETVQLTFISGETDWEEFFGQRITEIADAVGSEPYETYIRILLESELGASAVFHSMSEENLETVYAEPYVCAASDALYRSITGPASQGVPHPRGFGTFSRYLGKYCMERKILSLEEGLYRITAFPADRFGITDRGILEKGFKADVTVFDPDRLKDKATFMNPHQYSEGVEHVIMNGSFALRDGVLTGGKFGKVVK